MLESKTRKEIIMTNRIEGQRGIQITGYLVNKEVTQQKTPKKSLFGESDGASARTQYQQSILSSGKPLITRGLSRVINGQIVTTPTSEPLSADEINKALKRKDLDKDTRLLYNLELKRQQQGGYLTPEQGKQWVDMQNRQAEKVEQKLNNILKNGF